MKLLSFSGHDVAAKHPSGGEARGTKDGVGLLVLRESGRQDDGEGF